MKTESIFKYVLGGLIVIGFFILLIAMVIYEVPKANEQLLYLVVGALIAAFSSIVGYFYGSSLGSKQKTEIISKTNGNA